jgi:hypothetical protein
MFGQIGVQYELLLTNEIYNHIEHLNNYIAKGGGLKKKCKRAFLS